MIIIILITLVNPADPTHIRSTIISIETPNISFLFILFLLLLLLLQINTLLLPLSLSVPLSTSFVLLLLDSIIATGATPLHPAASSATPSLIWIISCHSHDFKLRQ